MSGRFHDQDSSNITLYGTKHYGMTPPRSMFVASDKSGVVNPSGFVRYLGPELAAMSEAQASPKWPHWKSAINPEMDRLITPGVLQVVSRAKENYSSGHKNRVRVED